MILIKFEDLKKKKTAEIGKRKYNLNSLLKKRLQNKILNQKQNNNNIITDPKSFFQDKISEIIIANDLVERGIILCGIYVANLLAKTIPIKNLPKSWFAIDYIMEGNSTNNPQLIKQGGDVCLLICTVFPERAELKMMKIKDYQNMGSSLFHQFYNQTGAKIGYHMSDNFNQIIRITKKCLQSL